ncbi:hypothetical protein A0H81_12703 [Grifola frondosa]|uniref:Uncharacterized protein n=1 Tax=Grifola frondosa TaxID=5627 RepID=A0A1C7LTI5_GRIFR|nr:hypothetical protein A0H81_12703 [Grifola frondosa]
MYPLGAYSQMDPCTPDLSAGCSNSASSNSCSSPTWSENLFGYDDEDEDDDGDDHFAVPRPLCTGNPAVFANIPSILLQNAPVPGVKGSSSLTPLLGLATLHALPEDAPNDTLIAS